jgi:hypothetical protein
LLSNENAAHVDPLVPVLFPVVYQDIPWLSMVDLVFGEAANHWQLWKILFMREPASCSSREAINLQSIANLIYVSTEPSWKQERDRNADCLSSL